MSRRSLRLLGAIRRGASVTADLWPLRPLGALVVAAGVAAILKLGRQRQDLVFFVVGHGALALVAMATLVVIASTVGLALALRRVASSGDETVEAQAAIESGLSLPALSWLPFVQLGLSWLAPRRATVELDLRGGRLHERVAYGERGAHEAIERRILVEDVFGFARLAFRIVERRRVSVLPARGRAPNAPLLFALSGGDQVSHPSGPPDGDLIEMRRYAPGDPIKRVLWKTYARSRDLMVRVTERAVSPTQRTIAYLVAGEGDEPAASLARVALERGLLGADFRFGADGSTEEARRVGEALPLIVRSRDARDQGGDGLAGFLDRAGHFGAARCVVFAPCQGGPWVERVARAIARRPGRVEVVLGADGLRPTGGGRALGWLRDHLVWRSGQVTSTATTRAAVAALAAPLAAVGATVTLADRGLEQASGRVHVVARGRRGG